MPEQYEPVPDPLAGLPRYGMDKDVHIWLNANCKWSAGEWFPLQPILDGYGAHEKEITGFRPADNHIIRSIHANGFLTGGVNQEQILGVCLRDKDAVPVSTFQRNNAAQALPPSPELINSLLGEYKPQWMDMDKATDQADYDRRRRNNEAVLEWRRKHGKQ